MPRAKTSRPSENAEESGTRLRPQVAPPSQKPSDSPVLAFRPLAVRLQEERTRSFVGREDELGILRRYLAEPSCSLVFVSGQAGIGKTAFLGRLETLLSAEGHAVAPTQAECLFGRGARAARESLRVLQDGTTTFTRRVLIVDGVDKLDPSEIPLFLELLAALPEDVFIVAASRREPPTEFFLDRAWSSFVRRMRLAPLSESVSCRLLHLLGVPEAEHGPIVAIAGGFPLALLAATEALSRAPEGVPFDVAALGETQHILIRSLCQDPVSPELRFVLEVLSLARVTTAELVDQLSSTFGPAELGGAYETLSRASFVDLTPQGLIPHALMRVALRAHFRRERPHRYRAMLQAIREYHVAAFEISPAPVHEYLAIAFLDRETPAVTEWAGLSATAPATQFRRAGTPEQSFVVDLVRQIEGPESAVLVRRHLVSDEDRFDIAYSGAARLISHALRLDTGTASRLLEDDDPANALIRRVLARTPLERDEVTFLFRWWMVSDAYQTPSFETLPIIALQTQFVLAEPRAVRSYCVFRDPKEWEASWNNGHVAWSRVGTFQVDGRPYHLIEFDFRRRSVRDVLLNPWENGERKWRLWRLVNDGQADHGPQPMPGLDELRVAVKNRVAKLSQALKLTPREAEILEQLCLGESPEGIARSLAIRPRTVKFHQENLLRKTGVGSRAELFRKLL